MMDSDKSDEWMVVADQSEAGGETTRAVLEPRNEPRYQYSSEEDGEEDSFNGNGERDETEMENEDGDDSGGMPVDLALEEGGPHLDIPSEYAVPQVEGEAESDLPYGVMDITVVGVVRGGKTSLSSAIAQHLCSRGWTISERDEGKERVQLRLEGSSNVMQISSASTAAEHSLSVKNLNVCVFVLPPHYAAPAVLAEMEATMAENDYDVLLPVICKADTMTMEELAEYRAELQGLMPKRPNIAVKDIYAVVCKERNYSWGAVSPTSEISQLLQLCNALESHLQVDTSDRAKPALLQLPCPDDGAIQGDTDTTAKTKGLKEMTGNRVAGCLFALLVAVVYVAVALEAELEFPEFARNAYSFEVLLFVLILTPIGPQKEFSVVLAIACAIFWRLAEETRQKEVDDMSLSYEKLSQENENSVFLLNSCDVQLQQCAEKFQNVSLRLYDTTERLSIALELCGSWCLDV